MVKPSYPYEELFLKEVSAGGGKISEGLVSEIFSDLTPRKDKSHDFMFGESRVETKLIRAHKHHSPFCKRKRFLEALRPYNNDTLVSRGLTAIPGCHKEGHTRGGLVVPFGNKQLQQFKPKESDYAMLLVVFLDKIRFYVFPSNIVSGTVGKDVGGKITMGRQHPSKSEGQIEIGKISDYFVYETDASIDSLYGKLSFGKLLKKLKIKK